MSLLCIDLDNSRIWRDDASSSVLYALSSLKADPEALFIIAPEDDGTGLPGASEVSFIYTSPITGKPSLSHSNLELGHTLATLGYQGMMIRGSVLKLSYISVSPENTEVRTVENMRGRSSPEFEKAYSASSLSQCIAVGPAGDNGVVFASLQYRGRNIRGEGLGNVFFQKGLKGIIVTGSEIKETGSSDERYRKIRKRIEKSGIARRIRQEGSCTLIGDALRLGWLPVSGYSRRFDPRAYGLDGKSLIETYGIHPATCQDCFFSCGRMTSDNRLLPYWKDMTALGSNLGFFSLDNVMKMFSAAMEEGLDTKYLGALMSYVMSLDDDNMHWLGLKERSADEIASLIHKIGAVRDAGLRYKEGLSAYPEAIQSGYHQAIGYDLRGCYGEALMLMLGLDIELPASLFLAPSEMDAECSVIFGFYEAVYSLALISMGFSPMVSSVFMEGIPAIAYKIPALARFFMRSYSAYGKHGYELFMTGLPVFEALSGEKRDIPRCFTEHAESAKSFRTVPAVRLYESYRLEKLSAEIWAKSRSEKRVIPFLSRRAAVGPEDDLGRDGEPGLTE